MVANLSRYKDHATLLDAWRSVLDQWRGDESPLLALAGRPDDTAEASSAWPDSPAATAALADGADAADDATGATASDFFDDAPMP